MKPLWAGKLEANLLVAKGQAQNEHDLVWQAAIAVLAAFTAPDYLQRILGGSDPFIKMEGKRPVPKYAWRIMEFADILFTLRHCVGFGVLLERLLTRPLREAFYEGQAAATLHDAGLSIAIRPESGVRGSDFDFSASSTEGTLNCEVTALTRFSSETLRNSLNSKRKQLPEDGPAIIFCTLPDDWIFDDNYDVLDRCVETFLRGTGRVNAVVPAWCVTHSLEDDTTLTVRTTRPIANHRPRTAFNLSFLLREHHSAVIGQAALRMGRMPDSAVAGTHLNYMAYLWSL
ncbi:hypothetical protein [Ensifer sp. OTU672]|uniref:hypothetical protein n=1 Tax=Ensifer sp. OTU672 TaxID=3043861 RepID=UPI00313AB0B6